MHKKTVCRPTSPTDPLGRSLRSPDSIIKIWEENPEIRKANIGNEETWEERKEKEGQGKWNNGKRK